MENKALKVLEYNKILDTLAACSVISHTAELLGKLVPFDDVHLTRKALLETQEARNISVKQGSIPLAPISDVRGALKRAQISAQLSCAELLNIAHTLRISEAVLKYFDIRDAETNYPLLYGIKSNIAVLNELKQSIFDKIISEDEIDDNASAVLFNIRRKKSVLSNKVRDILNSIIHSATYAQALQEPIITMRDNRYVVPVKSESRTVIPGVVHDTSQSGATLFVEPMKVVETNNEIKKLDLLEKEEINKILSELSAEVAENHALIYENFNIVIKLDFIFAKARLADKMDATCPSINADGIISIKRARHPLINHNKVVPIDIMLGDSFDTLVITGPNTGGKTVSLKTVGLLTLMAQSGLHIPAADGSVISVFKNVFADIGDEQSVEQSLSTFSSHMVNIIEIIKKADSNSLILFDELGAGTDPVEGAALATAILKEVKRRGAKTVATTHYSEIKFYALSTDRVENAACEFDVNSLKPTYRLLIGALGKSNAFAIAKRLGMGDEIIEHARGLIDAENVRFEDVVNALESNTKIAEEERRNAETLRREAEKIRNDAMDESNALKQKREKILDEARREAKKILSSAKNDVDNKIKELEKSIAKQSESEKLKAMEEARRKIKNEINYIDDKLYDNAVKKPAKKVKASQLKLGTTVRIVSMNQCGEVAKLPDNSGNMEIQVGLLKIKTHISTIELAEEKTDKQNKKHRTGGAKASLSFGTVKTELDIRGMNSDDGIMAVDKYLDDAYMAKLETVTLIHGKGTGVLRQSVHDFLRSNKLVKSFRLGKFGEGETGVTVVELK